MNKQYTHRDGSGMPWRFEGSRPVSALADKVMQEVLEDQERQTKGTITGRITSKTSNLKEVPRRAKR